ncbi:carboxylic ester hydrolase [Candidatus Roizmanbacteria bacterium]|nr:carboxylic ester hydrolase [Candidatus Roizmanbacteria bacterium]
MRLFEILLVLTNLLVFLGLVIPRLHALRWTGYLALIALILVFVQIFVEGSRWQMAPAYVLAGLFFLIWLLQSILPSVNSLIAVLAAMLGGVSLVVSIVLPAVLPVFHFPKPTGPYGIGTTTYHWIDQSRPEIFTTKKNVNRELMAQVWYPAKSDPSSPRAPYIQDIDTVAPALAQQFHFPKFFFNHLKYVTTNAVSSAPVAEDKPSYPVLIFLSGLEGYRQMNTFQIEELVSHGYIVVGLDQPGAEAAVQFPDGRQILGKPRDEMVRLDLQSVEPQVPAPTLNGVEQPQGLIPYFAEDVSFALDQLTKVNKSDLNQRLTGRLDLARIGTFGISLGGMNVSQACLKDSRLKACLIMDVYIPADVVKAGLQQPTMFMTRDAEAMRLERQRSGGWTEKDIALTIDTMRALYNKSSVDSYYLQIAKTFHLNFTDVPYWSPIASQIGIAGPVDTQHAFDSINAYSVAFFNQYLKNQPSPLLKGPSKQYPEVKIDTHLKKSPENKVLP